MALACLGFVAPSIHAKSSWSAQVWAAETLGSSSINGLAQTADGFLWVATPGSLYRFDGGRFAEFPPPAFGGESNGRVAAVCRSGNNGLWVAMGHGRVFHLNGPASREFAAGAADASPDDLLEDKEGVLWIAYHGRTIVRIKGGEVTTFTAETGSGQGNCALTQDTRGQIWLTQNGVVGLLHRDRFESLIDLHNPATRIAGAAKGGVWVCTGARLYQFEPGEPIVELAPVLPESRGVHPSVMHEDRTGALWIGTTDAGLLHFDANGLETVPTSFRRINHLLEDNEGNLWVGTGGGGLDRVRRQAMVIEGSVTGVPLESIQSLCEDTKGELWAATQSGQLVARASESWNVATVRGAPRGGVTCVAAAMSAHVWIGTRLQRIYDLSGGMCTMYGEADGIVSRTTNAILVDHLGATWLAGTAPGSVQRVREGKIRTLTLPKKSLNPVRIAEDANGQIWIGTSQGTLLRAAGDELLEETPFALPGASRSICSMQATPDGALWVGYERGGLGCVKDGRFTVFRTEHGLYSDDIRLIADDRQGSLWIGSGQGIFKVSRQALGEVWLGRALRVQSIRYSPPNDSPGLLATRTESGEALRTRDGRLWFPYGSAMAIVTPDRDLRTPTASPVQIIQIKVDDHPWAEAAGPLPSPREVVRLTPQLAPDLPAAHRKLEIEFACLSFSARENVSFRYRLFGFDDSWIEAQSTSSALYPRLPAGRYRFEVTASNSDGIWSEKPAVLEFNVPPVFWQTWWFRAAAIGAFTLLVTLTVRAVSYRRLHLKVQRLEKEAAIGRERSRIARDIHDDVGNRLTRILMLSGLAERDREEPQKTVEHLRKISAAATEVTDSLDEIVWAVNPRNDTLPHLIDYVGRYAADFLRTAGIRCRIELPVEPEKHAVPAEIRHNFFLGIKEALNNVVRHAGATEVEFRVVLIDREIHASVADNGRGFARAPDDGLADGLRNMRERMAEIGGRCEIESKAGTGTRISFTFPWSR